MEFLLRDIVADSPVSLPGGIAPPGERILHQRLSDEVCSIFTDDRCVEGRPP
jgi:hypothetical protein